MHVVYVCVVCASNSPFDGREGHAVPAGHLKRIVAGSLAGVRDLVEDRDRPRSGVAIHPSSMLGSLFLMDWIGRRGLGWSVRWAGGKWVQWAGGGNCCTRKDRETRPEDENEKHGVSRVGTAHVSKALARNHDVLILLANSIRSRMHMHIL